MSQLKRYTEMKLPYKKQNLDHNCVTKDLVQP